MSDRLLKESDVIEVVTQYISCDYPTEEMAREDAEVLIGRTPSADRPQGEWIRNRYWSRGVGMGEEYGFFYKCSMCEYEVESGYTRCGFNYCPYCGADMRGDRRWEMK